MGFRVQGHGKKVQDYAMRAILIEQGSRAEYISFQYFPSF